MRKWAKPADTATDVQSTWPVVPASVREAKEERIRYQVTNKQHFQRHRTMLDDRQVGLIVPLTHSLTHLPTHSLAHSLTHSLTHPQLIYSFTHLLTHSRTHALSHSLTHSLAMSPLPCPLCQALVLERIERRRLDRYAHRGTFLLDRCRLTDDCKDRRLSRGREGRAPRGRHRVYEEGPNRPAVCGGDVGEQAHRALSKTRTPRRPQPPDRAHSGVSLPNHRKRRSLRPLRPSGAYPQPQTHRPLRDVAGHRQASVEALAIVYRGGDPPHPLF